ncbi:MAG: hypothetical protein RIS44_2223, partial [Pseudomonadota bacterium]
IEAVFDELKTHLRQGRRVLRSKTAELVRQEFYGWVQAPGSGLAFCPLPKPSKAFPSSPTQAYILNLPAYPVISKYPKPTRRPCASSSSLKPSQ